LRVEADAIGAVDVHCGDYGIGPRVLYSSPQGLVMERLEGKTLEEADMHKDDFELLENVAKLLAKLHQLPVPEVCQGQEPMMWNSIEKMLEVGGRKPELWPQGLPSLEVMAEEVSKARIAIEKQNCPVVLCHGDFKPSNILQSKNGDISFIDHELGGLNYRSFDLMKVFRTAEKTSQLSMDHFIRTYAESIGRGSEGEIAEILKEAKLLECLTWLEAACFFVAMPQFKSAETSRWNELALDRWEKYEATKDVLLGKAAWEECLAWLG
jgi:ethanolamine kinase